MSFRVSLICIVMVLSGCVVHVNDDGVDFDGISSSDWERRQEDNRRMIEDLVMGQSFESVRDRLGEPAFSERFSAGQEDYRILRYRTHRQKSDGRTTEDETTPLVFENGRLIGWGETIYRKLQAN